MKPGDSARDRPGFVAFVVSRELLPDRRSLRLVGVRRSRARLRRGRTVAGGFELHYQFGTLENVAYRFVNGVRF